MSAAMGRPDRPAVDDGRAAIRQKYSAMATSQRAKVMAKIPDLLWRQQANTTISKQQEERQHVSAAC